MKFATIVAVVMLFAGSAATAEARGGRHGSPQVATAGVDLAAGHRHDNDAYTKAASEDREKLLTGKLKDICRGC